MDGYSPQGSIIRARHLIGMPVTNLPANQHLHPLGKPANIHVVIILVLINKQSSQHTTLFFVMPNPPHLSNHYTKAAKAKHPMALNQMTKHNIAAVLLKSVNVARCCCGWLCNLQLTPRTPSQCNRADKSWFITLHPQTNM